MIINAKFSSRCPRCGERIAEGTRVEWERGAKATHVSCGAATKRAPVAPQARQQSRELEPAKAPSPFVAEVRRPPCKRAHLHDSTGEVVRFTRGVRGDNPPAHQCYVVERQTAYYESAEQNEDAGDMQGASWWVTLHMRAATDAEAAPRLADAAIANADAARRRALADAGGES